MSKPITIEDLEGFMDFIERNKPAYDEFNVIQVETVLGTFLTYLKYREEVDS